MKFGSLFSGVGGLDLGLEASGMECVFQVEVDPFCRTVLANHWPNVTQYEDVRDFTGEECDLKGIGGRDSGLFFDFLRITHAIKPKWVLIENVAGSKSWAGEIEGCLASIGYTVSRPEGSAWQVGAPHLRKRVFWVANIDGKRLSIPWESGPPPPEEFQRRAINRMSWLSNLARVSRVDDGVPGGLDRRKRIEALGNAVPPQLGEWIGRRILSSQEMRAVRNSGNPPR